MNNELRLRFSFGSKYNFPKKLMAVADDGILIRWTVDNSRLVVQKKEFEENVMTMYPGFVQVGTFHNLRRLFRDYSFNFRIIQNKHSYRGLQVEFRHPHFSRDNFHLLSLVKKRPRKSKYSNYYKYQRQIRPLAPSSTRYCKRKLNFQRNSGYPLHLKRTKNSLRSYSYQPSRKDDGALSTELPTEDFNSKQCPHTSFVSNSQNYSDHIMKGGIYELFSGAEMSPIIKTRQKLSSRVIFNFKPEETTADIIHKNLEAELDDIPQDRDQLKLLQVFAKNELIEEEFWELITKKSCLPCRGMSWETIKEHIDRLACQELSPLHFKGYYYELPLSEM
ncbi:transmembrane protein 2 [Elysia marginata]|uniref:Transmembrane protein 2 n=1 Tax=Elysia marginata TaxID=1093978 RepID=A0AAV4F8D2_9GAST|nr:transmembrane protein 2 [Elysia marginata]